MCQTCRKLPGLECQRVLMCMIEMGWWIISLVNTQGKCYSVRNTGSSEEKNYYHIRCSMTHCCCYICFFCCCCFVLFCFVVILRQPNKIKLISELYRKKVNEPQHTNIPIPKLIIRTTMKRCGTQSLPAYVVFSASKKMVQI